MDGFSGVGCQDVSVVVAEFVLGVFPVERWDVGEYPEWTCAAFLGVVCHVGEWVDFQGCPLLRDLVQELLCVLLDGVQFVGGPLEQFVDGLFWQPWGRVGFRNVEGDNEACVL